MTTSYPARGLQGLTEAQWAIMYGSEDGIVEDYHASGIEAFRPSASGDNLTLGAGKLKINGYVLDYTGDTRNVPAVSSTTVYYVAGMYDPALNVEDASGNASPDGPCRLIVSAGPPSTSGGKAYATLFRITRNSGQTLAAALANALVVGSGGDVRSWFGPTVVMTDYEAQGTGSGPWPRGTRLIQTNPNGTPSILESLRLPTADGSALTWVSLSFPAAFPLPVPTGLVSRDGSPSSPQVVPMPGRAVELRGTLQRSSGANLSTGDDVILATLPVGYRPPFVQRWLCKVGPGNNWAEVRVGSDGKVTMTNTTTACLWIDLSPISFRAEV